MLAWLASVWTAVWPNLLANVVWIPLAWVAGRSIKRAMTEYVTSLSDHHRQHLEDLLGPDLLGLITDSTSTEKQEGKDDA